MDLKEKNKRKNSVIVLLVILCFGLSGYITYKETQPQTSLELMMELTTEESVEDLPFAPGSGSELEKALLKEYLPSSNSTWQVSQYFTVSSSSDSPPLLVETSAALRGGKLEIIRVKPIGQDFLNLLEK